MISLKTMAIGTLNIDRKLFKWWRPLLFMLCIVPAQSNYTQYTVKTESNSSFFKVIFFLQKEKSMLNFKTQVETN